MRNGTKPTKIKAKKNETKPKAIKSTRKPKSKPLTFDMTLGQYLDVLAQRRSEAVHVDADTVLGFPPIWRGCDTKASMVAGLPIKVYNSKTRAADDNHSGNVINNPHPLYGRFSLVRAWVKDLILRGNAYAEIVRDALTFDPVKLVYLDPATVTFDAATEAYKVGDLPGKTRVLLPQNILHFKGLGTPYQGYDPVETNREALSLGLAMQKYGRQWFLNHVDTSLVFTFPNKFKDPEEIQAFKDGITTKRGINGVGEPLVVQHNAGVQSIQPPSNEAAQWVQGREHESITAANVVGLPPHMVGSNISSSYNSFEAENKRALSDIEPVLKALEEELNLKLRSEVEKKRNSRYFEFVREGLLRADKPVEIQLLIDQLNNGVLTLRQVLEKLNMDTSDLGEEGDRRRIPSGVTFLDDLEADDGQGDEQQPDQQPEPEAETNDEETGTVLPEDTATEGQSDD